VQPGYGGVWIVLLDVDLGPDAKLHTLIHELAHRYGPAGRTEQEREVIAELSAAMVCQRLGLNVWPQATGYLSARVPVLEVQAWAVQRTGAEIDRLVAALTKIAQP
jgi:antirestriction protein ArdC